MAKKAIAVKEKQVLSEVKRRVQPADLTAEIRRRAYLKFDYNGRKHGNDLAHWFEAEKEVKKEIGVAV